MLGGQSLEMTNKIIGISGKKRHGKDTVGQMIINQRPNAQRLAYADALKYEVASMVTSYFKGQWYRDHDSPEENEAFRSSFIQTIIGKMNDDQINPATGQAVKEQFRLILQWWGTEFRRQMFTDSYWRDKLATKIRTLKADQIAVVTDVRFPDEADQIKEMGGILVRVNRPGMDVKSGHPSETALDNYGSVNLLEPGYISDHNGDFLVEDGKVVATHNDWDVIIENDGGLGDLEMKVTDMLRAYGY